MTTVDFITELFRKVDDKIPENKHSQAVLYPSEVVTLVCYTLSKETDSVRSGDG